MANKTADARAKCPYYLSESLLRIRCEGAVSDEVVSVFRTFTDKCAFLRSTARRSGMRTVRCTP